MTGSEPAQDTRDRLLDAAERLFGRDGIAETSLRHITTQAGANLASVNYHFGSKEALFREVVARRLGPISAERLRRLDQVEGTAGVERPCLEELIRAFVAPVLLLCRDPDHGGEDFVRLMGRVHAEPGEWTLQVMEELRESFERFSAAFGRALPDLPEEERIWRFFFLVGATIHTMASGCKLRYLAGDKCDPSDVEGIVRRLTAFLAAGFRAPAEDGEG